MKNTEGEQTDNRTFTSTVTDDDHMGEDYDVNRNCSQQSQEKNDNDNSMRIVTADDCNAAMKEDIEGRSPRRIMIC